MNREINESAISPYVEAAPSSNDFTSAGSGLKEKTFENCSFKVKLPELTVLHGMVRVSFKIMSKVGICFDVALDEIFLSDKLNRKYDQYYTGICKPKEESTKEIVVDVQITGKSFLKSDSSMILHFLAGDDRKYEICYSFKRGVGTILEYIVGESLSEEDHQRLEENVGLTNEKDRGEDQSGEKAHDHTGEGGLYDIIPASIIQKIEEYKTAVLREEYFIKNEGGRKHKVTNGNLIANKNDSYTYSLKWKRN